MKGETTVDDRCTDQTVAREALPRAHTNGRGGPGAYVNSMVLSLVPVKSPPSDHRISPVGGAPAPTENPRGPVWAGRVAERPVVPRKRGNAR